ncbi:rod-binding protein [Mangrovicoccus sp. HB182678]|uniref:Rod-binding protein n=2 Tax=Mangrovicoccus algicola TaxID=2771008 RepID=A0A8J6Z7B2_9RHOB|nr:rod-binding protein [Mangrovicoccus algicola]
MAKLAGEVETNFLYEFMKTAEPEESGSGFSGGIGEDQFSSFLTLERARQLSSSGALGLSEMIVKNLGCMEGQAP